MDSPRGSARRVTQAKPTRLTQEALQEALTAKVMEVAREPEYSWGDEFRSFMADEKVKKR